MRLHLAAAAVMAALWSCTAQAAWLEASSQHFVIYADDGAKDITRFSDQLERYHATLSLVLKRSADVPSPSNRVTVYVVSSESAVRKLYGKGGQNVAGFYNSRAGDSLAIIPAVNTGNGQLSWSMFVLLHEYVHHFLLSASASSMPRWFNEGAAEFFGASQFDADGSVWIGRPEQYRAGELMMNPGLKVDDLFDPKPEDAKKDGSNGFYGRSWLLYHYLTFEPKRAGQLDRYVTLIQQGTPQREAATQAFGDFSVLSRELRSYLQRPKMSALKLPSAKLQIGAPVKLRTLSAGEAAIMPVRIRSKRGVNSEQAKAVLTDALAIAAQYPNDPAVNAALAEAEFDAGNDKEAVAAADAALKVDPTQVNAYVQKGYALFREARGAPNPEAAYKAARAPFVALNHMEHDHPLPLIFYYRSFAAQGKQPPQLALDGLIRATEIAPFDFGLRMQLGWALIHLGRADEALVVLTPVVNNPHGGELAERARAWSDHLKSDPSWKGEGDKALASDAKGDADGS